tara:strand:+ start:326 stop:643 length:318 start_codon:yes stop_codon:yes gene_type:complete
MKFDTGKAPLALLPSEALIEIAQVLGFGAEKYGPNNWRDDADKTEWSRSYSSLQRHLTAFWSGQDIDPESGLSHLAHAATQIVILMVQQSDGHLHMDDRYKTGDE